MQGISKTQKIQKNVEYSYHKLLKYKYQTELLLTSYDFDEKKTQWKSSFEEYDNNMKNFIKNCCLHDASNLDRYVNHIKIKNGEIKVLLDSDYFKKKNNMDKALLVRFGELSRKKNKSEYFIAIRELVDKIQHLKQYQKFLLEDLEQIKKKVTLKVKEELSFFQTLLLYVPILIITASIIFALFISRFIKSSSNELRDTKKLLENILNALPVRVFWKDLNSVYKGANKVFLRDCNIKGKDQIIDKDDYSMPWTKEQAEAFIKDDKRVIRSKKEKLNIKETQTRADGSTAYLNTSKVPWLDSEGKVIGTIGLYEDITKYVKDEQIIKKQEVQLLKQQRLAQMGEMISMIAHQWRQPLNVISTISGVLKLKAVKNKDIDKENLMEKLSGIEDQTRYLSNTIDDFRNFFKPDKVLTSTTPDELIKDTLNIISPTLLSKNINVETNINNSCDILINKNEVMQVLLNIIKNAEDILSEKEIQNPWIKITSSFENGKCLIQIEDNGGGIPENILSKVFDPYFSTKDEKNGTGLGLYMSKVIIEEHCNGKLELHNSKNGAVFSLYI
jgi:signal transduction histidine kinase